MTDSANPKTEIYWKREGSTLNASYSFHQKGTAGRKHYVTVFYMKDPRSLFGRFKDWFNFKFRNGEIPPLFVDPKKYKFTWRTK